MLQSERILVATGNPGKLAEIREILAGLGLGLAGLADYPWLPESGEAGDTFADNAFRKASFYSRLTGLPALADDSGLEVDALGGAPGVRSARYAGPEATDADKVRKLLNALEAVAEPARTARFVCAVSLVAGGREVLAASGVCEGVITRMPAGRGGFGYDPVFLVPELGRTFAELAPEEKNRLSHRGRALRLFRDRLAEVLQALRNAAETDRIHEVHQGHEEEINHG